MEEAERDVARGKYERSTDDFGDEIFVKTARSRVRELEHTKTAELTRISLG